VESNTNRVRYAVGPHSVMRRYSEFDWLWNALSKEFPGLIIPPLPEKTSTSRFGDIFIESRRRSLEAFLHRVAAHPELVDSQALIVFLQASESGFAEAKKETTIKAKSSSSTVGWFESQVNTLTTSKVSIYFKICFFSLAIKVSNTLFSDGAGRNDS
jgi:sorting nexin-1/2